MINSFFAFGQIFSHGNGVTEDYIVLLLILALILGVLVAGALCAIVIWLLVRIYKLNKENRVQRVALRRARETKETLEEENLSIKNTLEERENALRRAERLIALLRKQTPENESEALESQNIIQTPHDQEGVAHAH